MRPEGLGRQAAPAPRPDDRTRARGVEEIISARCARPARSARIKISSIGRLPAWRVNIPCENTRKQNKKSPSGAIALPIIFDIPGTLLSLGESPSTAGIVCSAKFLFSPRLARRRRALR
ncbi:hypothetical protein CBM2637_B110538 [Cupriavidus taiwanensis]|nr:hypothetical protein CBM2637_B110538 [Cupriavidus taiwanensis]